MEYQDRVLKCSECDAEFIFTAGEQMFFADKGFKNEPKRCKTCKAKRAITSGQNNGVPAERETRKQPAHNAGRKPRFLSSRRRDGPSTAGNASSSGGPSVRQPEPGKKRLLGQQAFVDRFCPAFPAR